MTAILKREIKAYFLSPLGYVFIAVYLVFAGYFFYQMNLYGNSGDMRGVFSAMFLVTVFLVPILTMRLMSEDRKMKTDQILLMAPVKTASIVVGKLIAAICVFLAAIAVLLVMAVVVATRVTPEWPLVVGHFIGLCLLGTALISIGLFISALTENQIIAAIGGFSVGVFLLVIDSLAPIVQNAAVASVLRHMSFQARYRSFTLGILSFADIVFFVSVIAFFTFLTICAFEKRRFA